MAITNKNKVSVQFSNAGMSDIVFLLLLFFSLVGDGIGYFVSLYKEVLFRLY